MQEKQKIRLRALSRVGAIPTCIEFPCQFQDRVFCHSFSPFDYIETKDNRGRYEHQEQRNWFTPCKCRQHLIAEILKAVVRRFCAEAKSALR